MSDTKYNGWTNYATWRVNLELFDGFDLTNLIDDPANEPVDWVADQLKDHAEQVIFSCTYDERGRSSLMEDYARAFLQDVNWYEIAAHYVEDYQVS